jgi:hypothetical protein
MGIHTLIFYTGAFWSIARFFFLFQLVSAIMNPQANPLTSLLLLWIGSGQMCTALLFFLGGYMPRRFSCLRKITAVFTFMGMLPPCVVVMGQGILMQFFPVTMTFSLGVAVPLFIVSVDALFLAYLLLSHGEETECT